jgi:DNA-binding winged helix-turn-helix (wHTH) protein
MVTGMDWINGSAETSILFGPFRLLPRQRLLMEADKPVRLGSRAFDVLVALLERPGALVSKDELMAKVWPNTFVGPANLAVHISALRRALGDGCQGNRYVVNIPGRGYRFVAPVTFFEDPQPSAPVAATVGELGLCAPLARPVARSKMVEEFARQFAPGYFLTIVAQDGIGDTGVKLALVELSATQQDGVWFVDSKPVENS